MQIHEDLEAVQEPEPNKRRDTAPMLRLIRQRRNVEEETVRLPMSALAFWRDPIEPELETIQARLNLPENPDEEETQVGPLAWDGLR